MATRYLNLTDLAPQPANAEVYYNLMQRALEVLAMHNVISATTTAQPGSPTDEDAYILPTGATGTNWAGNDNRLAFRLNGVWYFYTLTTAWEGLTFYVQDQDTNIYWDGAAWGYVMALSAATVTPNATDSQAAATQLTKRISHVISGAVNQSIKLLPAIAGREMTIVNDVAATLSLYPASGDTIDGGASDAKINIAANKTTTVRARDSTAWRSAVSA